MKTLDLGHNAVPAIENISHLTSLVELWVRIALPAQIYIGSDLGRAEDTVKPESGTNAPKSGTAARIDLDPGDYLSRGQSLSEDRRELQTEDNALSSSAQAN